MAKRFVTHFDQDKTAPRGNALQPSEAAAMIAYWTKTATKEQLQLVATKLAEAHKDGKWIACDCEDRPGQVNINPPVMMVGTKKTESKGVTLYLFQRKERPRHADDCPFSIPEEEYERRARASDQEEGKQTQIDLDKVPNLLGGMKGNNKMASRDGAATTSTGTAGDQDDPLFGILSWLIEKAGIHRSTHEPQTIANQWTAIKAFAASVALEDNMTFADLLIRGERNILREEFQRAFKAIAAKTNTNREKVAYLLFVADALQRNEDGSTSLTVTHWVTDGAGNRRPQTETEQICCDIKHPARDGDEARAPYLVLIHLIENRDQRARPSKGVAQPIYGKSNLFPVDSNQERKTYRKLLQVGRFYARRGGSLQIEKPVRGRNTTLGVCRPDFIVWDPDRPTPAHTIIVETMGFDTPEYRERKAKTTVKMREIGKTLIEDDRSGNLEDAAADDQLYQATINALTAFAKDR